MEDTISKFDIGMKFDNDKPDWSLLPMECIEEVVKILTFGASKYGIDNWKKLNNKRDIDRIYSAMMRHIVSHKKGDKFDDETGQLHLSHAITNMIFLLYNELNKANE